MTDYPLTAAQSSRLAKHPQVSGAWAQDRNLWEGRKVAAVWMKHRGHAGSYKPRRTDMRVTYGTLVLSPESTSTVRVLGIREDDGTVRVIATSRVKELHDLTREKAAR